MRAHTWWLFLLLAPGAAAAQEFSPTPAPSPAPELAVAASFSDGRWLSPEDPIELRLSEAVPIDQGRLAVVIGRTDWTALFDVTAEVLRYRPSLVRLPRGESQLTVYLVSPGQEWRQLAQFPLRVLHPGGFEQVAAQPTVEISSLGQAAFDRRPEVLPTDRERYHDAKATLGILATLVRRGWTSRNQINLLGVSNRQEALRFASEGEGAPQLDVADYLLDLEHARGRFSVGHVQWDAHRYLVSQFATRGVAAGVRIAPALDLSLHAMNGTSIVGWSNFFGLDAHEHQVLGATLGLELVPGRPGGLRLSASYLDGSLRPLTGFNDALVNDAETSRGGALRLTASYAGGRFLLDAGYSTSRFDNPADPLLAQDFDLVPVHRTTRDAQYVDASYALLNGVQVGESTPVNLTAAVRHSRVDPLYRSVAALVQADQLQNTFELTGGIGQLASQFAWADGHDNLDRLPSLMTTTTRTATWTSALPLASLREEPAAWLPALTVTLNWQHQAGDGLPQDSLFDSLSHVPDQTNSGQTVALEWVGERWRAGYQLNRTLQDNRQPGRELADFETLVNTVGVGLLPRPSVELSVDLSLEDAENREAAATDLTRRIGLSGSWRPAARTSVSGTVTATFTSNDPEARDGRTTDLNLQFTQGVRFLPRRPEWLHAQLFVRFSRQTIRLTDALFGLADRQQFWSVNTGLTFRIF